jgi:hypothetical protein
VPVLGRLSIIRAQRSGHSEGWLSAAILCCHDAAVAQTLSVIAVGCDGSLTAYVAADGK